MKSVGAESLAEVRSMLTGEFSNQLAEMSEREVAGAEWVVHNIVLITEHFMENNNIDKEDEGGVVALVFNCLATALEANR